MPIASRVEAGERIEQEEAHDQPRSDTHLEKGLRATAHLTRNTQILLASLSFSTLCLFIRAIYRLVEVNKLPYIEIPFFSLILGFNFYSHACSSRTDGREVLFKLNDTSTGWMEGWLFFACSHLISSILDGCYR